MDHYRTKTAQLYVALCTEPSGTRLFVDSQGAVHAAEGSTSLRGLPDDWLYFGPAEGDFLHDDWGISREGEGFVVAGLHGRFEDRQAALQAAVEAFGLPAEISDALIDQVALRLAETAAERAAP